MEFTEHWESGDDAVDYSDRSTWKRVGPDSYVKRKKRTADTHGNKTVRYGEIAGIPYTLRRIDNHWSIFFNAPDGDEVVIETDYDGSRWVGARSVAEEEILEIYGLDRYGDYDSDDWSGEVAGPAQKYCCKMCFLGHPELCTRPDGVNG